MNGEDVNVTEYSVPLYMATKDAVLPIKSKLSREEQVRQYSPTLQDIYQGFLDTDSVLSKKLAAHMQIFVNGSLNLFNHRTNVDLNKKFIVFDLSKIKANIRKTAMLVMLEIVSAIAAPITAPCAIFAPSSEPVTVVLAFPS